MVPLKDVNGINSEPMALINQCQLLETIVVQEIMTSILLKKSKEINETKKKKKERRKIVYEEIMYPRNNLIQSYETLTSDKIKRRNNPADLRG